MAAGQIALVSVFDKTGVVEFCTSLQALGYQIVSTGLYFVSVFVVVVVVVDVGDGGRALCLTDFLRWNCCCFEEGRC